MLRINYNKVFFGGTMSVKKQIIQGTIVLTSATLLSRILGFLYRIFLSNLMEVDHKTCILTLFADI